MHLDAYTSIAGVRKERLRAFCVGEKTFADRDFEEEPSEQKLDGTVAAPSNPVRLMVDYAFGATSHTEL